MGASASVPHVSSLTHGRYFHNELGLIGVTSDALQQDGKSIPIAWIGPFAFTCIFEGADCLWVYDALRDGYIQIWDARPDSIRAALYNGCFFAKHDADRIPETARIGLTCGHPYIKGCFEQLFVTENADGKDVCVVSSGPALDVQWLNPHSFFVEPTERDPHLFVYLPSHDALVELGGWDASVQEAKNGAKHLHQRLDPLTESQDAVLSVQGTFGKAGCSSCVTVMADQANIGEKEFQIEWLNPFAFVTLDLQMQELWVFSMTLQGFYQLGDWVNTASEALSGARLYLARDIRLPEHALSLQPPSGRFRGINLQPDSSLLTYGPYVNIPYEWINPFAFTIQPPDGNEQLWVWSNDHTGFLELGNWANAVSQSRTVSERLHEQLL